MFKKILYPLNLETGDASQALLPRVIELAKQWHAELVPLYVLPGFGMPLVASFFPADAEAKMIAGGKELLDKFCSDNVPGDISVTPIVVQGTPYEQILAQAAARGADLIVMPHRGRSSNAYYLVGTTTNKVVAHADCAVLVLRASEQ